MASRPAAEWMEPDEAHAGEVRKLSTLLEASQALSATLDLKEGLQRVLEILGRHHGALRSTVVLLNESTGEVDLEASSGAIAPGKRVRYRVGEGITGQVVQTGKPMVVPRVSREPAFLNRVSDRPELAEQKHLVCEAVERLRREKFAPLVPSVLLGMSYGGMGGGLGSSIVNSSDRWDADAVAFWEVRNLGLGERAARNESSSPQAPCK